jgi:nucleotide-binding universal stress UspA family protein
MHTFPARILLATDGSVGAEFAARTAIRLATGGDCELHLIYVVRLPGYPAYVPISVRHLEWALHEGAEREALEKLWELASRIRAAGGPVAGAHLRTGKVVEEVLGLAEELEVDLIVVGSRDRSGVARTVMGSVSGSVVRHARCPVVVARSLEEDGKRKRGPRSGISSWGSWGTRRP